MNRNKNRKLPQSSSEDDSDDDEPIESQKRFQQNRDTNLWDSFQNPPVKKQSGSTTESAKRFDSFAKILKVFVSLVVFVVVLGTSVVSKLALLFMTSHVKQNTQVPFCNINQPEKEYIAIIPTAQRIAWIWCIFFAYAFPEFGVFFRSFRMCFFKNVHQSKPSEFILVLVLETFHVIGLALLTIFILPNLDSIQGVMLTNCVCFIPALLAPLSRSPTEPKIGLKYFLDILAIIAQISGLVVWPVINNTLQLWTIPVSLLLISVHWWQNYVSEKSRFDLIRGLERLKKRIEETRYNTYLYLSLWKIFVFLLFAIVFSNENFSTFFNDFKSGWGKNIIQVNETQSLVSDLNKFPDLVNITSELTVTETESTPMAICWTFLIHFLATYCCYVFAKFSCKIHIQSFSFAVPINLTTPVCISVVLILSGLRATDVCYFHGIFPDYLFFTPPPVYNLDQYLINDMTCLCVVWLMSQLWITRHIWISKANRNASTDQLFVTPMYNSLLVDQSVTMNRRREDRDDILKKRDMLELLDKKKEKEKNEDEYEYTIDAKAEALRGEDDIQPQDKIPQVFVCATMWHEEKEEMIEFLKSILRLDEDQCSRRMAMKYLQGQSEDIDKDYYDLETHIFLDDAFVTDKTLLEEPEAAPINLYVKRLISVIEEAATEVYQTPMKIYPPTKIVAPYGGRLEWRLPGRTKMICHLKHAKKIRKKKRWSQVMYMYYLLGYKIMQLDASDKRKLMIAKNTFLLALDGDIDFQPQAVTLLIDRMKVDDDLGAACGRIHPVGNGPLVWYQKFEYAIGHWLQKATEHIIGCVLCSPGCFSLFRGRALMENSVMKKYTTNSEQARDYVQYDQGEDRWLCTLLLKQSFRVEYSAAADAYTHSPEAFNEFYNQRRRWVPSTISNILDLLGDAKDVIRKNNSISMMYIVYQILLMVGTLLGPGTIFLMMVGSLVAVFSIGIWTAFLWNFIPLVIYMILCLQCKQKYQLMYAMVMSAVYALVMMAVLIGVIIQFQEDGIASPTSLFFFAVALQIVITGLLHPMEWTCLFHGVIYYVTIPSMYMLLFIYSLFNMNDVSWGTRDKPQGPANAKGAPEKKPTSRIEKLFGHLKTNQEEEGSLDFGFSGLFRCMLCTHRKTSPEQTQLLHIAEQLDALNNKISHLELKIMGTDPDAKLNDDTVSNSSEVTIEIKKESVEEEQEPDKPINLLPDWIYDPDLRSGDTKTLTESETKFWEDLVEKYLKPIELTDKEGKEIKEKLTGLRNMCVSAFLMINSLFVLVIFLLQLNKSSVYVRWPFGATNTIIFDENEFTIIISREYLNLEPIGLLFVLFFGVILFIQFIAMLIHRFSTISQILATTTVDWYCSKKAEEISPEADLRGKAVDLAKIFQRPKKQWDEEELDDDQINIARRRDTIHKILYQHGNRQDWSNLETNFLRRLKNDKFLDIARYTVKKKATVTLLNQRRSTIVEQGSIAEIKRKSILNPTRKSLQNHRPSIQFARLYSAQNSIDEINARQFSTSFENRGFQIEDDLEMQDMQLPRQRPKGRQSVVHFA